jgi:hypothetical protein
MKMENLTITEALSEIKTVLSRLEKKRAAFAPYLVRDSRARDPFESSGGSAAHIRSERQAVRDLEERVIKIRTAIQKANLDSTLVVCDKSRTVAEWLTWRREISKNQGGFLDHLLKGIRDVRSEIQRKGGKVTAVASAEVNLSADALPEAVICIDEKELIAEQDNIQRVLGSLDGKLSLFNATKVIEF